MTNQIHILLVEDSPTQADEFTYSLQQAGYKVTVAEDGLIA